MSEASYPDGLYYNEEHDWARVDGDVATFGITWYAQDSLGEVVYFAPSAVGTTIERAASTASWSRPRPCRQLIAPLSGEVTEINDALEGSESTVNDDPYGEGWLVKVRMSDPSELDSLMDAAAYSSYVGLAVSFTSLTDADRAAMLAAIGVDSIEELFAEIPEAVRLGRPLDIGPALSESELSAHMAELAARNVDVGRELSFLGAGMYDHYVPAVVDMMMQRGEFLTAYTPYQPEMSQGVLQAIFEYQTAICELTGMDVSNASGYDGTTVAADACYVAKLATGRTKVVVAETLNPQARQVVRTFAPGFGMEVVEVPHTDGATDPDAAGRRRRRRRAASSSSSPTSWACSRTRRRWPPRPTPAARCRSRTSTRCRWACWRPPAATDARWRSARASRPATTCPTAAPTTASWPRGRTTPGSCPAASWARRSTATAAAASC